jgi:hypothetical protein
MHVGSGHAGYVAGRYRDGSWSDHWTDVARCAAGTFTAYRPACRCGWTGPAVAADGAGLRAARLSSTDHALAAVTGSFPAVLPGPLRRCRVQPRPAPRPAWA